MASQENPQLPQRIRNQDDIAEGTRFLLELDPSLADEIAQLDGIPLRLRPPGFAGLAQITASTLLAVGEKPLIQAGLSRAKQKTLISLADSIVNGGLDLDRICVVPQSEAMAALTGLHGIGPWTAEVFLSAPNRSTLAPCEGDSSQSVMGSLCAPSP